MKPKWYREEEQRAKEDFKQGIGELCGCLVVLLVVVGAVVGVVWLCKVV